ncbi:alpha-2,3-sialyltransferase, partial [Campylobacter lari]|nr:alpha-2,3-sialyltransferase [Campylobacter lari]
VKPNKEIKNKSLNLLGIELLSRVKKYLDFPWLKIQKICNKYFTFDDPDLKFQPKKEIMQSYLDYFEESNEWVRKEFFSLKERLFPKKDLSNYKENYELKEMKPEYWDKIAEFIADIIEIKNQNIIDKANIIQNKDKVIIEQTTQIKSLHTTIKQKDDIINFNINHINQLQNNIQEKSTQLNQAQSKLSFQTKYGTAKSRIQNQLSYKLGQAMIANSKSILGCLIMPVVLLSIIISYKQEQKIYQEKIKKDPSLKLPSLEDYPDYQEVSKLKNQLSYKLGQALIQANKTWYKGGYVKMWFEVRKLKREFRNKI